ncbi:hypothetical protein CKAH01_10334 [Colletotrichum kahawae]|uniref:Uncharacterized protein n=1 Tax=Colletotrichum kahawae TaxID=34407 RepID=A0AAD9XW23_COLKA|nr:hypothetical protein CKAH01_10334 [Colletotrichum kahawae]
MHSWVGHGRSWPPQVSLTLASPPPRRRAGDGEQGQHRGRVIASVGLTLAVMTIHAHANSHLCHCLALPRSVILVDPGRRGSVSIPTHTRQVRRQPQGLS